MTTETKNLGYNCCFDCGKKYGTLPTRPIGTWIGDCSICGRKDVSCAASGHDFRIYKMPDLEKED